MSEEIINFNEDKDYIHNWFGLSYANYLVLPRSILQSMSDEWQKKMTDLLYELEDKISDEGLILMPDYTVEARDSNGKYIKDIYRYYWRDNQRINGLVDVFGIDKEKFERDMINEISY